MRKLPIGPSVVRGALAEVIQYAVTATVAKSAEKAAAEEGLRARTSLQPEGATP